jgi:drug/metabolite transporter (DMT)-like permease
MFLAQILAPRPAAHLVAGGPNPFLLVPLALACVAILIVLPLTARRGHLHIPGYVGFAFLAFLLALLCGYLSGRRGITATPAGVVLSVLFYLLVATAVGSVLALFFHRDPPEI